MTPELISCLEDKTDYYKKKKLLTDRMKSVKKSVVSQRQTMDMKQLMLDHFHSKSGHSNYATLKQKGELPGHVRPKNRDDLNSLEGEKHEKH